MDGLLLFWIGLCLAFILLETATPSLFFFFAGAVGSAVSIITYWLGFEFYVQAGTFIIATTITLIAIKYAIKHLPAFKTKHHQQTNSQALIGKQARVTQAITADQRGYVKINGQIWAAENIHHENIATGTKVEVVAVSGAHVKIKEINTRSKD